MKNPKYLIALVLTLLFTTTSYAMSDPIDRLDKQTVKEMNVEERTARVAILENRLSEIQEVDFKTLERVERREMKKELRYIQKEMKAQANGGVYISATALLIIIILLILL